MKKITFYLLIVFLLGLTLRIIGALNTGYMPDDSNSAIYIINFSSSGKLERWDQSSSLWYNITDIFFRIFGVGHLTARLATIIFGSLAILAMYLLTKEFFNERAGIIAAFLLAISPFVIRFTITESDPVVLFFLLMSAFLFFKAIKNDSNLWLFVISGLFLGLGVITKVYPLLFGLVFIVMGVYQNYGIKNKALNKKFVKGIILFSIIVFLFLIPTLTYNYLLYKDKKIMDFIFTNILGFGREKSEQFYSWAAGWGGSHDWIGFFLGNSTTIPGIKTPTSIYCLKFLLFSDPLVFILGAIGLVYCFFKKRDFFIFFAAGFAFVFAYLATIIPLSKHFIFMLMFFVPASAVILSKIKSNKILKIVLVVILVFNLFFLGLGNLPVPFHFYGESAIAQVMDFKKDIGENSLIVADSRIYRGEIYWMFYGKPFLEAMTFLQINQSQVPGTPQPIDVYYFECVTDDCGWGTIKNQPDFNYSMEYITDWFKQNGVLLAEFNEPERYNPYYPFFIGKKVNIINVYRAQIVLNSGIIQFANQPKSWFMEMVGYSGGEAFDDYTVNGAFDKSLDWFAHFIIYISIVLAFLGIGFVIYLILKKEEL